MADKRFYPIGTPGQRWGAAEIDAWRARVTRQRSHADDVLHALEPLRRDFDVFEYGALDREGERLPFMAIRCRPWDDALPTLVVTGGVHGYETSGVLGALQFVSQHGMEQAGGANLLVVPCVSPWAYERIQRWNADARSLRRRPYAHLPSTENETPLGVVAPLRGGVLLLVDLPAPTYPDESVGRRARAARDGEAFVPDTVPDGFYLVDDIDHPQPAFQRAVIDAVARVTHIAPPDANGQIIGTPLQSPGVISFAVSRGGLCAAITGARFSTTTEVYPDSPRTSPQACVAAQVTAVRAAIDYALAHAAS